MTVELASALERVLQIHAVSRDTLSAALAVSLIEAPPSGAMHYYEGRPSNGPFERADLRLNAKTGLAFLVLFARKKPPVVQSQVDMHPYGPLRSLEPNPMIPPEGTVAYRYEVRGARVAFEFTSKGKVLICVSVEWPPTEARGADPRHAQERKG
jgi:hypothetical protein